MIKSFTIVTLCYKNWHLLSKSIQSVFDQNFSKEYTGELIILDDGSEDFDIDLVAKIVSSNNNCMKLDVKIFANEENIGTVASFNRAISESKGDVIIPLAADDYFFDEFCIEKIITEFNARQCYILTALRIPISNHGTHPCQPEERLWHYFDKSPGHMFEQLSFYGNFISGSSTYYRRNLFDRVGLFDESYSLLEDYPFYLKVLNMGIQIELLCEPLICYRMGGVSTSVIRHPRLERDYKKLYHYILENISPTFFQRRRLYYTYYLSRKEKKQLMYAIRYPDQVLFTLINNLKWL